MSDIQIIFACHCMLFSCCMMCCCLLYLQKMPTIQASWDAHGLWDGTKWRKVRICSQTYHTCIPPSPQARMRIYVYNVHSLILEHHCVKSFPKNISFSFTYFLRYKIATYSVVLEISIETFKVLCRHEWYLPTCNWVNVIKCSRCHNILCYYKLCFILPISWFIFQL